jgi:hypothetical protein
VQVYFAPTLVFPEQGGTYQSPITFQWQGTLSSGQAYLISVWHIESGSKLQSEPLYTTSWTTDLPGEKVGEWEWSVSIVQGRTVAVTSEEWRFWFDPFPGSGGGGNGGGDEAPGDRPLSP